MNVTFQIHFSSVSFLKNILFISCEQGRGRGRERQRIPSRLDIEPNAGLKPTTLRP